MAKKKMYQRPDGLFEVIRIVNGKRVAFRGRTQRDVEQKMLAYKEESTNGPLFKQAAEDWWEEFEEKAAPNSLKGYKPALARAQKQFDNQRLFSITSQDIKTWISQLVRKKYAAKTIKTHLIVLNGVYKKAQEEYNTDYNPAALVRLPSGLPQKQRGLPSEDDNKRMLTHAISHPFGLFAFLAKYTGGRRGELLGLKYGDFDYTSETIRIRRSVYYIGNKPAIKEPKTSAGVRSVPLLDIVKQIMPKGHATEFIFSNDGGKTPLLNSRFEDLWKDYCNVSGVTATPHQWRHMYATVLFDAGVEPKDAQTFLGHAQLATTMDIYTHFQEQRIAKATTKLNDYTKNEKTQ